MKRKRALSILIAATMALSAAGCGGGGSSSNTSAVEMRVQRQEGTVSLSNEKGESVTLLEKMRLNAGHNLDTAKESFVTVSMDETKVLTLEENGGASVVQNGNTLQFEVKKGNAFVSLTEELKGDQAVEVRSGNMICGMRGTNVQAGENEKGEKEFLVAETSNPDGLPIKAVDGNGNVIGEITAEPGKRVVYKGPVMAGIPGLPGQSGASGSNAAASSGAANGTSQLFEKSDCGLEDFSSASLVAMGNNQSTLEKISKQLGVEVQYAKDLTALFSQTGLLGGDQGGLTPLYGEKAQAMGDAAKATRDATGKEMKTELAILDNTRKVMDNADKKGLNAADMASVTKNANDQMNGIAKAAKDAGAQGDGLAEIAKVASGQILEVAGAAIDGGLSVGDINGLTNASGEGLSRIITSGSTGGLQAANFDTQRVLNQINAEVSRQQSSTDSLRQLLRERAGDSEARYSEQAMATLRNGLSGQNAANGGNAANVTPVPAPTPAPAPAPTPAPTPENETPPASNDDDDDDDDYSYTPSTPASSSAAQSSSAARDWGVTEYKYYIKFGSSPVPLTQMHSFYTNGVGMQELTPGNKTITVDVVEGQRVLQLIPRLNGTALYPQIQEGLYYSSAGAVSQEPSVSAPQIVLSNPGGDVSIDIVFMEQEDVIYQWSSNAIEKVVGVKSDNTTVEIQVGQKRSDITSYKVHTKSSADHVSYVTIQNGEMKSLTVGDGEEGGKVFTINNANAPIYALY